MKKQLVTLLISVLMGVFAVSAQAASGLPDEGRMGVAPGGAQHAGRSLVSSSAKTEAQVAAPIPSKKPPTGRIEVAVEREFSVTLASNPTTGYHWELAAALDEGIVKLVNSTYQAPATDLLGAGGEEIWTFKAVGRGETVIELKYVRPWEKGVEPADRASFRVTIH